MLFTKRKIYEGKAKIIFATAEDNSFIQHFKDDITAFNNAKKEQVGGKGIINNSISSFLMAELTRNNIKNHLIKKINDREQLVRKLEMIPVEVVVRNISAGSFAKNFGYSEGQKLRIPLVEFFYKNDSLSDPLIAEEHIILFDLMSEKEIKLVKDIARRVNNVLLKIFKDIAISLVDFKLEFGKFENSQGESEIFLGDEISPDTCRLWDDATAEKFDKDRYRLDIGSVLAGYEEVAKRLGVL